MLKQIALGILRHLLSSGAGVLVAHGYLTQGDGTTAIGAAMVLITIGMSAVQKVGQRHALLESLTPTTQLQAEPSGPGTTATDLNKAEIEQLGIE